MDSQTDDDDLPSAMMRFAEEAEGSIFVRPGEDIYTIHDGERVGTDINDLDTGFHRRS